MRGRAAAGCDDRQLRQRIHDMVCIGGKGRYENASGDGNLTVIRYTPLAAGADLVSEYSINLRLPVTG